MNENIDKDWIQEKCNTNKPPTKVPDKPSVGNKSKNNLKKALEIAKTALETYSDSRNFERAHYECTVEGSGVFRAATTPKKVITFYYDEGIAKNALKEIEELMDEWDRLDNVYGDVRIYYWVDSWIYNRSKGLDDV